LRESRKRGEKGEKEKGEKFFNDLSPKRKRERSFAELCKNKEGKEIEGGKEGNLHHSIGLAIKKEKKKKEGTGEEKSAKTGGEKKKERVASIPRKGEYPSEKKARESVQLSGLQVLKKKGGTV